MKKKIILIFLFAFLSLGFISCSNSNDDYYKYSRPDITPDIDGEYNISEAIYKGNDLTGKIVRVTSIVDSYTLCGEPCSSFGYAAGAAVVTSNGILFISASAPTGVQKDKTLTCKVRNYIIKQGTTRIDMYLSSDYFIVIDYELVE